MDVVISSAINTYHELNPSVIDALEEEPSPLEFMRYVAKNRPFVVKKAAREWRAYQKWDADYLREHMDQEPIKVAITPYGNADAVVERPDGRLCFVEPYEVSEPFSAFLGYVQQDSRNRSSANSSAVVKYAQTQNDNLRNEYELLFRDVPSDIAFARIALGQHADAINMWIGNERSTTSLHKDNYENIYVQIRGQKHFVLLSPIETPCVNEQLISKGRYRPVEDCLPTAADELTIDTRGDEEMLPIATWDPDNPEEQPSAFSHLSQPIRITLDEGDMLYLPAMWYHKVKQTSGEEGFACAVNYWYDMDFAGGFWTANSFMRDASNLHQGSSG